MYFLSSDSLRGFTSASGVILNVACTSTTTTTVSTAVCRQLHSRLAAVEAFNGNHASAVNRVLTDPRFTLRIFAKYLFSIQHQHGALRHNGDAVHAATACRPVQRCSSVTSHDFIQLKLICKTRYILEHTMSFPLQQPSNHSIYTPKSCEAKQKYLIKVYCI